jgi:hypothetical protein
VKLCHHCGRDVQLLAALQRTDTCRVCGYELKCCLNCRFFDPARNNQCREPQADWIPDKEKANFCEFFDYRQVSPLSAPGLGGARSDRDTARAAFDNLFGAKKPRS